MHSKIFSGNSVTTWKKQLASKPESFLLAFIILWGLAVTIMATYLVVKYGDEQWVKFVLAGIILYEILP